MSPIRTLLWIGRGRRFAGELVADAPTLDVVWEAEIEAASRTKLEAFDAILFDADDADAALQALAKLRLQTGIPPVVIRIDSVDAPSATALRDAGAAEVLLRPSASGEGSSGAELSACIERLAQRRIAPARKPKPGPDAPASGLSIVGASRAVRDLLALVERAARSRTTVLVTGETGTGKELVAHAVHAQSVRRRRPFIAFNCAAFPETLLESELFGHAKGAFTGADREHKGLFAEADRGTLFLDEISETTPSFQAKLLRVLQEREVRALGSARARRVDVRVIAASNRDLWADVTSGDFREDLLYRLAVFPIHVPPLRERSGDVASLAEFFLARHGEREGVPDVALSSAAVRQLERYAWPGNVRELENEIQRALALVEPGTLLTPEHFSARLRAHPNTVDTTALTGETLRATLQRIEASLLRNALAEHGGHRSATARTLGITREGLYKKLKRLGIS
jgi:transcriptional regulator with GAF, ATPase, and Fis domain